MTSTHETPVSLFSHNKCGKIAIKHWEHRPLHAAILTETKLDAGLILLFYMLLIWRGAYGPNAPRPRLRAQPVYNSIGKSGRLIDCGVENRLQLASCWNFRDVCPSRCDTKNLRSTVTMDWTAMGVITVALRGPGKDICSSRTSAPIPNPRVDLKYIYTSLFTVHVETKKHTRKHTTRKIEKKHKNTYLTNN